MSESKFQQIYRNTLNNARGQDFEGFIESGCEYYAVRGRAHIDKTPEPFRVTSKQGGGVFTGRFTALAQPDFQGTLDGGRSIVFEAKYTTTDRLTRDILTDAQQDALERHGKLGALAGVCAGIGDGFYFLPWGLWRDMKTRFGRKYVTANDIEPYRVRFTGAVLFLDYISERGREE
jgi:recombination protein U